MASTLEEGMQALIREIVIKELYNAELHKELPELLTIAQAAKELSVTQSTIRRMEKAGDLEFSYIRSAPRVTRESLLAAKERGKSHAGKIERVKARG